MSSFSLGKNRRPSSSKISKKYIVNPSPTMTYIQQALSYALSVSLNAYYIRLKRQEMTAIPRQAEGNNSMSIIQRSEKDFEYQNNRIIRQQETLQSSTRKQKYLPIELTKTSPDQKEAFEGISILQRRISQTSQNQKQKSRKHSLKSTRTASISSNSLAQHNKSHLLDFNIQQISIKEEADIPGLTMKNAEIIARRQALMNRKVDDWSNRPKKIKIRRQIRGLMS